MATKRLLDKKHGVASGTKKLGGITNTAKKAASGTKAKARNQQTMAMDRRVSDAFAQAKGVPKHKMAEVRMDDAKYAKHDNEFYSRQYADKNSPLSKVYKKTQKDSAKRKKK